LLRRGINYSLSFILAGIFLYIAFYNVDIREVLSVVSQASFSWVLIFLSIYLFAHYVRALRWKVILNSVKPHASVKNLFGALMVGYGVNCVVPRLGEIARAVLIGKWEGLSRSSMFGAIIVERIIDMIFSALAVLVSLFIWNDDLRKNFPWLTSAFYFLMLAMGVAILLLYLIIRFKEKFYGSIVRLIGRLSENWGNKTAYIFSMLTQGFGSLKGTRNYILTLLLSIIIILLYASNAYIGFFTLGMEKIRPVTFAMGWVLFSISTVGVIIPTPGGTGSYHTFAKSVLVLLFGFSEVISLSYAFLTHIISYFSCIFAGLLFFLILNKKHENLLKVLRTEVDEL
jgi:uncharacterized protein (TIRG00374 family)